MDQERPAKRPKISEIEPSGSTITNEARKMAMPDRQDSLPPWHGLEAWRKEAAEDAGPTDTPAEDVDSKNHKTQSETSAQGPRFTSAPPPAAASMKARLAEFLPRLREANLEVQRAEETFNNRDHVMDDAAEGDPHIAFELGLGVWEEKMDAVEAIYAEAMAKGAIKYPSDDDDEDEDDEDEDEEDEDDEETNAEYEAWLKEEWEKENGPRIKREAAKMKKEKEQQVLERLKGQRGGTRKRGGKAVGIEELPD